MISTKIKWNGRRESFDELKAVVEGHFDGCGASHLVHPDFIATYLAQGYRTPLWYPDLKITPVILEKQNCVLYGSLKQICRSKAAQAIIKRHESQRDGMKTWHDFLRRYDNMGSADVKTLHYEAMLNKNYSSKYPGGLEQYALDYEEAFTELESIGEHYTDAQKKRRILFNLYDTTPETQVITSWCERHCATFADVVTHLTDTSIRVSHYNGRHAIRQAKQSQLSFSVDNTPDDYDTDDLRTLLQTIRDNKRLPDDLKIPSKAWNLLSPEARDGFIQERAKILKATDGNTTPTPPNVVPKQYGGVSQTRQANATTTEPIQESDALEDSDTSTDDEETIREVSRLLRSHKATRDAVRFLGMTVTTPSPPEHRTIHVNLDPGRVRSLASRLTPRESIVVADGGCDTGLLGTDWYVLEYTNRYANVVGFDEFVARKSGLPIVVAVTKFILPDNKGAILLRHNEGVYNKDSRTTLFSEFQLRTRGCIVDSTFKGHRGADSLPGTQRIITPDDENGTSYIIPLRLRDALMTFNITMPTEDDLTTLPLVDLTPDGIWTPSDFNKTNPSLSFVDSSFDPPCLAQTVATTSDQAVGDHRLASDTGEGQRTPDPTPDPITEIFYDAPDTLDEPIPNDDIFHATSSNTSDMDGLYYFDPSDIEHGDTFMGRAFHLTLEPQDAIDSHDVDTFLFTLDYDELRGTNEEFNSFAYMSCATTQDQAHKYILYLRYCPINIIRKTLENTMQLTMTTLHFPMRQHIKAHFPWLNCNCL